MRTIVAYRLVSMDGVAQDPDEFVTTWDDELDANLAEVISSQTTVLLGSGMHDEWARYWPTSDVQPFADFINAVDKRVVTSTPLDGGWTNVRVLEGDLASAVAELRAEDGGDIGVHGSMQLIASMLAAGLVDELRLAVFPAVAGSGRRLFDDGAPSQAWELVSSAGTPSGAVLLHHRLRR